MTTGRERLIAWLRKSGLKQYELAEEVRITAAYLSQVLSGVRRPSLPIAVRIQDRTGVTVESWVETARGKSGKGRKPKDETVNVL